ncbi:GNAT family N-acetyltransferase [Roseibium denhamense]|nr:GNAT family N-acetyltransferase [Roseibium denhamense]
MPSLRSGRLWLRPVTSADMGRIVSLVGNFQVVRNLGRVPHPYTMADAKWWVNQTAAFQEDGERAVAIDDGTGMIGAVSLGSPGEQASLGYWLGEPYWGSGYMSEAVGTLVDWFFKTSGETEILSSALDENTGSIKVLTKTGFKAAGPKPLFIPSRAKTLPATAFRLQRSDFERRKTAA